jgi:hypothetical protein
MVLFGLVYFQPSENVSFFKILHTSADGKIDEDTQRARVIDKNRILMYYSNHDDFLRIPLYMYPCVVIDISYCSLSATSSQVEYSI